MSVAVGFEPARHLGLVERLEAELLFACGAARVRGASGCAESLVFTVRVRVRVRDRVRVRVRVRDRVRDRVRVRVRVRVTLRRRARVRLAGSK